MSAPSEREPDYRWQQELQEYEEWLRAREIRAELICDDDEPDWEGSDE